MVVGISNVHQTCWTMKNPQRMLQLRLGAYSVLVTKLDTKNDHQSHEQTRLMGSAPRSNFNCIIGKRISLKQYLKQVI
jgi:hypothetical protein